MTSLVSISTNTRAQCAGCERHKEQSRHSLYSNPRPSDPESDTLPLVNYFFLLPEYSIFASTVVFLFATNLELRIWDWRSVWVILTIDSFSTLSTCSIIVMGFWMQQFIVIDNAIATCWGSYCVWYINQSMKYQGLQQFFLKRRFVSLLMHTKSLS